MELGIIVLLQEKQNLEKIQIEEARIVAGATKLVSFQALFNETGWETLEALRKKQTLTFFYKMCNGLSPAYLSSLVPPNSELYLTLSSKKRK